MKYLIIAMLLMVGCSVIHNEPLIITSKTQMKDRCIYRISNGSIAESTKIYADCDKWAVGDTLQ